MKSNNSVRFSWPPIVPHAKPRYQEPRRECRGPFCFAELHIHSEIDRSVNCGAQFAGGGGLFN